MVENSRELLKLIPSVDSILKNNDIIECIGYNPETDGQTGPIIVDIVRQAVDDFRKTLLDGSVGGISEDSLAARVHIAVKESIIKLNKRYYRKVINASGIILHTALGRAVVSRDALAGVIGELGGYNLLQMDLNTGKRTARDSRIGKILNILTGIPDATVVNNNAAATVIVLNTIASGREVIVSRGQLVEIGGSFRLPDVMKESNVKLIEVGTTNKTHARDFEDAINENTAAIMRVHPSNYKISGFTSEVPLTEMAKIAKKHDVLLYDDVGAGALLDYSRFGFAREIMLKDSFSQGADIISCSADKLIGACQGGLVLGNRDIIGRVRKNPWARILRVDKITLSILETTLTAFLDERRAFETIPTLIMLRKDIEELADVARYMADELGQSDCKLKVSVVEGFSQMGSGSLPGQDLPTMLLSVKPETISTQELASSLRKCDIPVIVRIKDDCVLFDPRTLQEGEEKIIINSLKAILQ